MTKNDVVTLISKALKRLGHRDLDLLMQRVGERCLTARLAGYMDDELW